MTNASNSHRALIVIDVQNEYDGGNLPIEYPPFSMTVKNVARAMDVATASGVKVVVVKMMQPSSAPVFAEGSHGGALHPEIADKPYDHYIEKTQPSSFTGTDLELWLRTNGITTLTIVGYMTHNCDLSTVIHASHMGFTVELLSDATGSLPYSNSAGSASAEEIHRVMLVVMHSRFAAVATTDEWVAALAAGKTLELGNILVSNQAARALNDKAA